MKKTFEEKLKTLTDVEIFALNTLLDKLTTERFDNMPCLQDSLTAFGLHEYAKKEMRSRKVKP